MIIVALDPGKRTGIACWADEENPIIPIGFSSYEFDTDGVHRWLAQLTALAGRDVRFVSESFIITINTAKNTQASWSLRIQGALEFVAATWFGAGVTMQAPNIGKTFGTNGKLKYLGWFKRANENGVHYAGHANDAARHLATYAAQRGLIFTKEQLIDMASV